MWPALLLVASTAGAPPEAAVLAPGTRVRLTAPPAAAPAGPPASAERVDREGPLLVFRQRDGTTEAAVAPGASAAGDLVGVDDRFIHLQRTPGSPPVRIRRESVARVEVSAGRKRSVGRRTLAGLGIGLGVGGAWMAGAVARTSGGFSNPENQGYLVLGAAFGAAAGAAVGAVAGLVGEERWREVPLEALGRPGGSHRPPDSLGAATAS
jgi:hypothetical protein